MPLCTGTYDYQMLERATICFGVRVRVRGGGLMGVAVVASSSQPVVLL